MGMSASQMRYCLISGRKSDVEYQGQQINQQRTALATQSSAYNNQLLNLSVPTPPSTDDYSTSSYSFAMNGNTYTITGTTYDSTTGTYKIDTTVATTADVAKTGLASFYSSGSPVTYSTGTTSATKANLTKVDYTSTSVDPDTQARDKSNLSTIYGTGYATLASGTGANQTTGSYYKYTSNGVTRYVTESDLKTYANTSTNATYSYVDEGASTTVSSSIKGASITWSETGRMTAITDSNGNTHSLNVSTTTNESAYNDAMNEYEYQKNLYDQSIEQINSRVCVVESEDKKLELKLKDLDTQQEALNTEMDAVKKVIDKNIEVSFKAFG